MVRVPSTPGEKQGVPGTPASSATPLVDPGAAKTRLDFAECLLRLKESKKLSYVQISLNAESARDLPPESRISASTAHNLTNVARVRAGKIVVRDRLVGFLVGCRLVEESQRLPWLRKHAELYPAPHPPLPEPPQAGRWIFVGQDAARRFARRARGRLAHAGDGDDLFRGRSIALAAVRAALDPSSEAGVPIVMTGQPGAGKSTILSRVVCDLQAAGVGPGVAVDASTASISDLLGAITAAMALSKVTSVDELLEALALEPAQQTLIVAVDAIDEASMGDRRTLVTLLLELALLPWIRVVVATRPRSIGAPYRTGSLLADLGVESAASTRLVDLDTDQYFDQQGLVDFVAATLTQHGRHHPGPPGRAWQQYRTDPDLTRRLAAAIAQSASRNFLVAALAATGLSTRNETIDPAGTRFTQAQIPTTVGQAVSKYLDTLAPRDQARIRGLLVTLAYARGSGVSDARWLEFANALGYPASRTDIDELRHTPAVDYLLQTRTEAGGRMTRLFHRALVDDLLDFSSDPASDEAAILATLLPGGNPRSWADADVYALRHAADHAHAAGKLPVLLSDDAFLAVADMESLLSVLRAQPDVHDAPIVNVLRQAAHRLPGLPPARRMQLLALTAARLGLSDLQRRFDLAVPAPHTVAWAHDAGTTHQVLIGDWFETWSITVTRLAGRDVVIAGGTNGAVRVWDESSTLIGEMFPSGKCIISALAAGWLGESEVIVTASDRGPLQMFNVRAELVAELLGAGHAVNAVVIGSLGGRDVLVSGGQDGTIRMWDQNGVAMGEPVQGHPGGVNAVVIGSLGGRDVVVSGGEDDTIRIWDDHGAPIGQPIHANADRIWDLCLVERVAETLIVSATGMGMRLWNGFGLPWGGAVTDHRPLTAVATGMIAGRQVIASGGFDNAIRLWDLDRDPSSTRMVGHVGEAQSVAVTKCGDTELIVSVGRDGTRLWDHDGRSVAEDLTLPASTVSVGALDGRGVIAVNGAGRLALLDCSGRRIASVETSTLGLSAIAVGELDGTGVVISADDSGEICVWDKSLRPLREPIKLGGLDVGFGALAIGRFNGRQCVVAGGKQGEILVANRLDEVFSGAWLDAWQIVTGERINTLMISEFRGQRVIVSGDSGGAVVVRDQLLAPILEVRADDEPIVGVVMGKLGGRDVLAAAGFYECIYVWDTSGKRITTIDLVDRPTGLAIDQGERLYASMSNGLSAWQFTRKIEPDGSGGVLMNE